MKNNTVGKNALEWSVFGAGLVALLALIAIFAVAALDGSKREPELRVRLGKPEPIAEGFRTQVTVENVGDESTQAVKVEVEDVELDFDYVPRRSRREGSVMTKKPPKEGRVLSWQSP